MDFFPRVYKIGKEKKNHFPHIAAGCRAFPKEGQILLRCPAWCLQGQQALGSQSQAGFGAGIPSSWARGQVWDMMISPHQLLQPHRASSRWNQTLLGVAFAQQCTETLI